MQTRLTLLRNRDERGSALPVVLALAIGVGALTAGYSMRTLREKQRDDYNRYSTEALYQAWAQMEVVAHIVNSSGYDGLGNNEAVQLALARDADPNKGEFIGPDGWPTGVEVNALLDAGGNTTGMFDMISEATVGGVTRRVSALVRERQSFADFNYFVAENSLGISGGLDATFPFADAPEGSIHSNDQLIFYFPDRHFRDAVTAVNGFDYAAGATVDNTNFHGPVNDAVAAISGLTDVDPTDFATRGDTILPPGVTLDGQYDWARVYLKQDEIEVQHNVYGHNEEVPLANDEYLWDWVPNLDDPRPRDYQTQVVPDPDAGNWQNNGYWGDYYTTSGPHLELVAINASGAPAGPGDDVTAYVEMTVDGPYETRDWVDDWDWIPDPDGTMTVPVYDANGDLIYTETQAQAGYYYEWAPRLDANGDHEFTPAGTLVTQWVSGYQATYDNLPTNGTLFVEGLLEFDRMTGGRGDVHSLDGRITFATNDRIDIEDTMLYVSTDADGNTQTAYLNGSDHTQPYIPNPDYTGNSVIGLIARNRIRYEDDMPDQSEVNATMLSKNNAIRVGGVEVEADGTVWTHGTEDFVKTSLRRLGGIVSNRRPVTSYIDGNNVVTRGFVYGKSIFDTRQRVNPPTGFPVLNRPRILATVMKELN